MPDLETCCLGGAIVLFLVLIIVICIRGENYTYEKVSDYESDGIKNMLQLPIPPLRSLPPTQPFIISPQQSHPVPIERYGQENVDQNMRNYFQKFDTAYDEQLMNLPPVVKRARLNPLKDQPVDPYSGLPIAVYTSDDNISKFYKEFVPDNLWCKEGVCGK